MTKSTITREQLIKKAQEQIEFCRHTKITGEGRAHVNQCAALFEIALAAMDSEPVGKPFMYGIADPDGNAYIDEFCVSEDLGLVEDTVNELNYDREEGDEHCYSAVPLYRHAQQPVVPDAIPVSRDIDAGYLSGWNDCRAAMLQAGTPTNEGTRQVDELTMWIKRLVRSLKNSNPDSKLPREAMDYLTAKGLISVGGVLR